MKKPSLIIFCGLFVFLNSAKADVQPQVMYRDYRVLGMGGAFTAVADDKNALFYNPAGFASIGLKKQSVAKAQVNPAEWKPKYRTIPDIYIPELSLMFNNSFFNEKKQKAIQTLIELGIIPVSVSEMNDFYKSYSDDKILLNLFTLKQLDIFRFFKMGPFKEYPETNYGWGNLTDSQLEDLNDAINDLATTTISLSMDQTLFSFAVHYFGLGAFSSFDYKLKFDMKGLLPEPSFSLKEDLILIAGFGMPVPNFKRLHLGISVKSFVRVYAKANNWSDYLDVAVFDWENAFKDTKPQKAFAYIMGTESLTGTNILPKSLGIGFGSGFDIGGIYKWRHGINFGFQLSDIYTRIRWLDGRKSSLIPVNARAGISWRPSWTVWGLFEDPVAAFDLDDLFFNYTHNLFLKIHAGLEFKTLLKGLILRLGINQGYPTFGLCFDLSMQVLSRIPLIGWLRPDSVYFPQFNMNKRDYCQKHPCCCLTTGVLSPLLYAHSRFEILFYGRELGRTPGSIPDEQIAFKFSLFWGF